MPPSDFDNSNRFQGGGADADIVQNIIATCPACGSAGEVEVLNTESRCIIFMCSLCPFVDFAHGWPVPELENGIPATLQTAMVNRIDG
jgi:hypothetical protein